jgi:hypothetical protein
MKTLQRTILLIVIAGLAAVSLFAQGVTIGSGTKFSLGGATLFLPSDWSNAGTFSAENGTIIFNGAGGTQTITNASGETFNNLTVNKASGDVRLANNCTVNGTLTISSGDLNLNGSTITLGPSGLLSETAGNTVKGTSGVITTTRTLTAPGISTDIAGLGLSIGSTADLGSTVITRGHAVQYGGTSILRYCDVVPANNSGLAAVVKFKYDVSELNGNAEAGLKLIRSTNTGADWEALSSTIDTLSNFIQFSPFDAFARLSATALPFTPTITDFNPKSGAIGTSITITGTNFDPVPSNNIVYFGAVRAQVVSSSSPSLTVTTPLGATYQPITVMVKGLTAYSSAPFIVTFPGGGNITSTSLAAKIDFTTGTSPLGVAIGDLDGDGKADLVVVNNGSNAVSIFRNTGASGTVRSAVKVDITTGNLPKFVAIGDIDGDGKLDLAVTNSGGNTVSIFKNTSTIGSISFNVKLDFTTGINPQDVVLGDVDGDGKTDVLVINQSSNSVSVLRNISTGGTINFASKVDFTIGSGPLGVAIGDVDGDGKIDLAVTNSGSNTVSIFRNTSTSGSVSFDAKIDFATGTNPRGVALGDVDGDGKPDVAVTNNNGNTVSIFKNTSTSGSVSFDAKIDFTTGTNPHGVVLGDVDGDGKLDAAVISNGSNTASIFRNTSTVSTVSFADKVDFTTGSNPRGVALGDIDGDGRPDVVVTSNGDSSVSVLRNTVMPPAGTPQNLSAQADYAQATLKWNKVIHPDLKCYRIYRSTSSPASTLIDSTVNGVADTVYNAIGLTNGITYYFRVTSVNDVGNESGFSNEVSAAPMDYAGVFLSIADIPHDQGGQVHIKWQRSLWDTIGSTPQITSYSLMRKMPVSESAMHKSRAELPKGILSNDTLLYYDYLMNIAALQISRYSVVAPTLEDSTSSGIHRSHFLLIAHTSNPNMYYISREDSGYSVDNIAPLEVTGLITTLQSGSSVQLNWNPNTTDPDVGQYDIYRSNTSGFTVGPPKFLFSTRDTIAIDSTVVPGTTYYYRVTAVDIHGNESIPSEEKSQGVVGVEKSEEVIPRVFSLLQNYPNPFNPTTTITFTLAENGYVSLKVYDILGREVVILIDSQLKAGAAHQVTFDASRLSAGIYLYRLQAGNNVQVKKLVLLK